MNFGTAQNRLRKMVLLSVLQRHGENVCFRCSGVIENTADLTIEHKVSWLNKSESFWDLTNVAFSHQSCNYAAGGRELRGRTGHTRLRLVGPSGTAWCVGHAEFLPEDRFGKNKSRWNGLQSYCRECQSARAKRARAA